MHNSVFVSKQDNWNENCMAELHTGIFDNRRLQNDLLDDEDDGSIIMTEGDHPSNKAISEPFTTGLLLRKSVPA